MFDAAPSFRKPSRISRASAQPASTACWRARMLASSEMTLRLQCAQRSSATVIAATPTARTIGRRGDQRRTEGEGGRRHAGRREGVVALVVGTARDLQVDRLVGPRGFGDQPLDDRRPAGDIQRVGQPDAVQRRLQPRQVFGEAEGAAGIDGDQLINPVAVEKTAIERRNAGFSQRQEAAIQIDGVGDVGGHGLIRTRAGRCRWYDRRCRSIPHFQERARGIRRTACRRW